MSTIAREFTKEQLQQIEAAAKEVLWPVVWSEKKAREHFSEKITPKVVLELARIALASLEAEAVDEVVLGEYDDCGCHPDARVVCIAADGQADWENFKDGARLYAAPPAPASVPDDVTAEDCPAFIKYDLTEVDEAWARGFNACRDAMLQGADGNSPVIPDGWVACSERMPEREVDVQVYCAEKKEQMVAYLERNEGEGLFRFATWRTGDGIYCQPTHWMPLPAAPQQEAKNV
ncbi:DUF551 domain-containing protein [Enterobacter kobei]|uniref:DUF551 domain-containing protein n=1 Tax=Enterobacter kobei TaxID=208224 RepID=UPI002FCFA33F